MYAVSDAFLNKTKDKAQSWYVRGTIGTVPFDDNNIIEGSLTIANRCSDNSDITLGAVYIGELTCTFYGVSGISRSGWEGKDISLSFGLDVNGAVEWIPFGVYRISEAVHSPAGVDVTAYDNMRLLDKRVNLTDISVSTPMQLLQYICTRCGVELGTNSLAGFVNANQYLQLHTENDIETYRDLLYWVCQTICAFATMDRAGRLVVRRFVSDSVDTHDWHTRYEECSFSDYTTRYTGISYVDVDSGKTRYIGADVDDGTTINLGSNPFLQINAALANNILSEVMRIRYIPFTVQVMGGAHYDLGDVINHTDGSAGTSSLCCIMAFTLIHHSSYEMQGIGANPALATAKSKTDKNIVGLRNKVKSDEFIVHHYENAAAIEINNGNQLTIIDIAYGTKKDTTISLSAEIQLYVECIEDSTDGIFDAEVTVTYNNNGEDLACEPSETYLDGSHILHLIQKIQVDGNVIGSLTVSLTASGCNLIIPAGSCKAWLEGTGLVAEEQWDGIIRISDTWTGVVLDEDIQPKEYNDTLNKQMYNPVGGSFAESIQNVLLPEDIGIDTYLDYLTTYDGIRYDSNTLTYGSDVTVDSDGYLVTNQSTAIITTPITSVSEIKGIHVEDLNATYLVSFDGGITYMTYDGTDWVESSASSMTKAIIEAITDYPSTINGVVIKATITSTSKVKAIWIL